MRVGHKNIGFYVWEPLLLDRTAINAAIDE